MKIHSRTDVYRDSNCLEIKRVTVGDKLVVVVYSDNTKSFFVPMEDDNGDG